MGFFPAIINTESLYKKIYTSVSNPSIERSQKSCYLNFQWMVRWLYIIIINVIKIYLYLLHFRFIPVWLTVYFWGVRSIKSVFIKVLYLIYNLMIIQEVKEMTICCVLVKISILLKKKFNLQKFLFFLKCCM